IAVPALASTSEIERLWTERLECVARYKQHGAFVHEQKAKMPEWTREDRSILSPHSPHTWLMEQMEAKGFPRGITCGELRWGGKQEAWDAAHDALEQSEEYRRRDAVWKDQHEQIEAMATELGISDEDDFTDEIMDEINDIADQMAELAEAG